MILLRSSHHRADLITHGTEEQGSNIFATADATGAFTGSTAHGKEGEPHIQAGFRFGPALPSAWSSPDAGLGGEAGPRTWRFYWARIPMGRRGPVRQLGIATQKIPLSGRASWAIHRFAPALACFSRPWARW